MKPKTKHNSLVCPAQCGLKFHEGIICETAKKKFKLDFGYELQTSKELMKYFDKWLSKNIGKRCKTRAAKCPVCIMYALRDLIVVELI